MAKYIIYAPRYNQNVGGIIALHKLIAMLKDFDQDAKIWPFDKPHGNEKNFFIYQIKLIRWVLILVKYSFNTISALKSPYNLSIANSTDLENAIVIYPEIVNGNPLNAQHVVRWLLNKPGALTGSVNFGDNDLFFYFQEHFNDWNINPHKNRQLRIIEWMDNIYMKQNDEPRSGTCYMVRKGKHRTLDQHDENAIKLDGLSHEEIANVFNTCKYFISYDPYTMYSRYAALCGCIPIVVPLPGVSKEQWRPELKNRYGIAYGWDDIPWALETREKLFEEIRSANRQSKESVKNFIKITQESFALEY